MNRLEFPFLDYENTDLTRCGWRKAFIIVIYWDIPLYVVENLISEIVSLVLVLSEYVYPPEIPT